MADIIIRSKTGKSVRRVPMTDNLDNAFIHLMDRKNGTEDIIHLYGSKTEHNHSNYVILGYRRTGEIRAGLTNLTEDRRAPSEGHFKRVVRQAWKDYTSLWGRTDIVMHGVWRGMSYSYAGPNF